MIRFNPPTPQHFIVWLRTMKNWLRQHRLNPETKYYADRQAFAQTAIREALAFAIEKGQDYRDAYNTVFPWERKNDKQEGRNSNRNQPRITPRRSS